MNKRFIKLSIRSFFLQSLWNFKSMQNIGFLFVVISELRKIYKDDEEAYKKAVERHLEFFNIHPYMLGVVVGLVLNLEEKAALEKKDFGKEISGLKTALSGPLSALGDYLFWGLLRPFSAIIAFILFFFSLIVTAHYLFSACVLIFVFLILFNIPHFYFIFRGLSVAYTKGQDVVLVIKKWRDFDLEPQIKKIGFLLLLSLFFVYCIYKNYSVASILGFYIMFLCLELIKKIKKFSSFKMLLCVFGVNFVLGYFKVGL